MVGRLMLRRGPVFAALLSLWLLPGAVSEVLAEPADGDRVRLTGTVFDSEGQPMADIAVVLEASRERFSLRHFEERRGETLQLPQRTDEGGRFQFDWTWDRHYNTFTLALGLEVSREGRPGFEITERRDVTAEMVGGAPPALNVTLENAGWLRWLRLYIDGNASEDEKKIYREYGRPQKLTVDPPISSWWYFELGKVFRLDGGRLDQIIPFEPIPSVPDPSETNPSETSPSGSGASGSDASN